MMMFWKARLVILAVPKTGTQALDSALGAAADMVIRHPPGLKHARAQRYRRAVAPLLDPSGRQGLETVAVLREPVDWLSSWHRYRARAQIEGQENSTAGVGFAAFVEAYLDAAPPPFARVGSQARFVSTAGGRVLVDHLFAYERPAALRAFLAERLGRHVAPPPRRNVSPPGDSGLPDRLLTQLRREMADDFALHDALMQSGAGQK